MTRLWHWIRRGLLAVVLLFLAYQLWFLGHVLWWKWVPPPRPAS
jgi:monofunctional biosynthetic peptidoglycan transglycosylase